jgi:hypothetical protein
MSNPRSLRKGSADPPHTEDADTLAGDTHAEQLALADPVAPALAHDAVILRTSAGRGEQQHHGVVGGALVQHAGGVCHHDAAGMGGRYVDMVVAHADRGANPDSGRQSGDGSGVQRQRVGEHDRVGLERGGRLSDLGHRHVGGALGDDGVEIGAGTGDHPGRRQTTQHEARLHDQ